MENKFENVSSGPYGKLKRFVKGAVAGLALTGALAGETGTTKAEAAQKPVGSYSENNLSFERAYPNTVDMWTEQGWEAMVVDMKDGEKRIPIKTFDDLVKYYGAGDMDPNNQVISLGHDHAIMLRYQLYINRGDDNKGWVHANIEKIIDNRSKKQSVQAKK